MADPGAAKHAGGEALQAFDRALSKKPRHDGHDFSEATKHLCKLRDLLIEERRSGGDRHDRLGRVNAIISLSMAGQFPLGNAPWPEIEHARQALEQLVAES